MASSEKRCLYEVLGVHRDCSADEIRSAYKRLALQRHPDKLVQSGVPEAEATAAFQELVNAYEVLSDPRERAWYDSNRNQILFSSNSAASGSSTHVPDLFPFFSNSVFSGYADSGRGFYKVYSDLFDKIYANEVTFAKKFGFPSPREAPVMGNLESPYVQVTAFYNYWLGFTTVLDFFWVDEIANMPNRKARRLLEEHNKKLRKAERKKYNDIVRQLAEFVKKRDKRVRDMQIKKNEEVVKKRELEKQRMKELERLKAEKARNYEEPDWAKVEEIEEDETEDEVQEKKQEFYCVICSKKFKSDKQWKNHEQSRKHKEKAAEFREAFSEDDYDSDIMNRSERDAQEEKDDDDMSSELQEQFEYSVGIQKDSNKIEVEEQAENNEDEREFVKDDVTVEKEETEDSVTAGYKEIKKPDDNVEESKPDHFISEHEASNTADDFTNSGRNDQSKSSKKNSKKKGSNPKQTHSSKERNQQGKSSFLDNTCEKCGEQFESRNKLHKHLGETGHASLKYR